MILTSKLGKLSLIAALIVLSGCAGTMNGMIRGDGQIVQIKYEQAMKHDDLVVTMPDGETYKGKAVMASSSGFSTGNSTIFSPTGSPAFANSFGVVSMSSGNFTAVLFGDRGGSMRCAFQYASSFGTTDSGGVGVCETSKGIVLDVQW